ncbi:MAG: hypothetical protein RL885_19210 [Planctomycetota bacterium]
MRLTSLSAWTALTCIAFTSCASPYVLKMPATKQPIEDNVVSSRLEDKQYDRLIVIPPSGTARGQFDALIALFEKEFLRSELTVVSSSITGRVVYENTQDSESRRVEGAQGLSDTERALVMAKETGADGILQIGQWDWSDTEVATRFFVLQHGTTQFQETDAQTFNNALPTERYSFSSPSLHFVGKLLDIEDGQVVATFDMTYPANWCLPNDYSTQLFRNEYGGLTRTNESFTYSGGTWLPQVQEVSVPSRVIQRVAQIVTTPNLTASPQASPSH